MNLIVFKYSTLDNLLHELNIQIIIFKYNITPIYQNVNMETYFFKKKPNIAVMIVAINPTHPVAKAILSCHLPL